MAPEQARGKPVDQRADVWAFGAVLYEMLAGKSAFSGDDVSDMLVSVIRDEPDWSALPEGTPAGARQALRLCLQKDPRRRVRDISAIRLAIDGALELDDRSALVPAAVSPAQRAPIWRRATRWAIAPLLASLATGIAVYGLRSAPSPGVSRFVIATPPDAPVQGLLNSSVAISRDGARVVYRTSRGTATTATNSVLYVHEVGTLDVKLLPGTEGASAPFFSPDGEWIAYVDGPNRSARACQCPRRAIHNRVPAGRPN